MQIDFILLVVVVVRMESRGEIAASAFVLLFSGLLDPPVLSFLHTNTAIQLLPLNPSPI